MINFREKLFIMENTREVIGHVIKEETISLIQHHLLPNTVVINIDHPFPGYHGSGYDFSSHPRSIIILTQKLYSFAKILRAQKRINHKEPWHINASFAKLKVGKQIYYGIRIKGLNSYDQIPNLQKEFLNLGFELLKSTKIKTDRPVSIKISKFFHIKSLDEAIYADKCIDDMYYIEIPDYLSWENFRTMTEHVKHNVSNNNFDVVKGIFYKNDTVKDMIRIYKPKITLDLLREIKQRYTKAF